MIPKSRYGFRVAHQLYPVDSILFTAAVAMVGTDLEVARIPTEMNSAFSYRFEPNEDHDYFQANQTYYNWLQHQFAQTIFNDQCKYIVKTDISDFYHRIYFHRIEKIV